MHSQSLYNLGLMLTDPNGQFEDRWGHFRSILQRTPVNMFVFFPLKGNPERLEKYSEHLVIQVCDLKEIISRGPHVAEYEPLLSDRVGCFNIKAKDARTAQRLKEMPQSLAKFHKFEVVTMEVSPTSRRSCGEGTSGTRHTSWPA